MAEDRDKTKVLSGDPETLAKELEKAKEQGACFIVVRGPKPGARYFPKSGVSTIGREPTVEISIPDPSVSRKHATVTVDGEQVTITDCGSANGTVINGRKIAQGASQLLQKEDIIRLGQTMIKFVPAGEVEALMYSQLELTANQDPLTKVFNRRYVDDVLGAEFKRAKALSSDFAIAIFDIDHFKKINDVMGHDAGDQVLKDFATLIKTKHTRPKDVFGRYGGEEFLMLFLNTSADAALAHAQDIRSAVEMYPFEYEGKRIPVTVSIGVADVNAAVESVTTLYKEADKALYRAKEGGRNRVEKA